MCRDKKTKRNLVLPFSGGKKERQRKARAQAGLGGIHSGGAGDNKKFSNPRKEGRRINKNAKGETIGDKEESP